MGDAPKKLYFLTGNENKLREVQILLGPDYQLEKATINLPELQEIDTQAIIEDKLRRAIKLVPTPLIVEDTSLHLDCLGGLPGPLIKWFLKSIGNKGLAELAEKYDDGRAYARTIIGLAYDTKDISFVEGKKYGYVVPPRGESSFGWDHIFIPDGYAITYAEMGDEKQRISHRRIAVDKLKKVLDSRREQK